MTAHLFHGLLGNPPADRVFLRTPKGGTLTYGDVMDRSARLAHALFESGVRPGDRVAVQVEKSPEAILLCLACARAGAVYLPLNTAYTLAELAYFIADAEPALFVGDPSLQGGIEALLA